MSKIKLTGSNSGYVEISSVADAGNLTLALPTAGTALLSNAGNVFTGITTFTGVNITDDITFNGASYNVLWDKSDNQLEFGDHSVVVVKISHAQHHTHIATNLLMARLIFGKGAPVQHPVVIWLIDGTLVSLVDQEHVQGKNIQDHRQTFQDHNIIFVLQQTLVDQVIIFLYIKESKM